MRSEEAVRKYLKSLEELYRNTPISNAGKKILKEEIRAIKWVLEMNGGEKNESNKQS